MPLLTIPKKYRNNWLAITLVLRIFALIRIKDSRISVVSRIPHRSGGVNIQGRRAVLFDEMSEMGLSIHKTGILTCGA